MFIAHLPAGYLSQAALPAPLRTPAVTVAALVGSVAPDLDLLYFYLPSSLGGGGRQISHHHYWSHTPAWWMFIIATSLCLWALLPAAGMRRVRAAALPVGILLFNVMLHHVLDTPMGGIRWMWPASGKLWVLFDVPARHAPWVLNFVLHPTFLIELSIVAAAGCVWLRSYRRGRSARVSGNKTYATDGT